MDGLMDGPQSDSYQSNF